MIGLHVRRHVSGLGDYFGLKNHTKRFSKWHKAEKNNDLDAIQQVYECNRTVAKMYLKVLNEEQLKSVHEKLVIGG